MKRPGRKPKPAPVTLAEYARASVTVIEVDNPLYNRAHGPDKTNQQHIPVAFNMRESYVGWLFARGLIDGGEKRAADKVRQAYERMGGAGASAIDYGREHVDGGHIAQTITDSHLLAAGVLRDALSWLGQEGYSLTMKLAAEGRWLAELSNDERRREFLGNRFRECLDTLAVNWGFKMRRIRA